MAYPNTINLPILRLTDGTKFGTTLNQVRKAIRSQQQNLGTIDSETSKLNFNFLLEEYHEQYYKYYA